MADFVKVLRAADLAPGGATVVNIGETPVALFNVGGAFHALNNNCIHRMGPLGEGELEGSTVVCPWHAWRFDVATGQCLNRPGARVQCYETRVEGDDLFVKVGD